MNEVRALLLVLALGAAGDGLPATYRVRATARLTGVPLVSSLELRGDVALRPGDGPRAVRVHLASRGHACDVTGSLTADERLSLAPGQRCPIALDDPGLRGDVVATLRSGEGRLEDGRLTLSLELDLAGTVRVATGGLPGLGREATLPVDGAASIRAE